MFARLLQPGRAAAQQAGQARALAGGKITAKGVVDTVADAARAAAGALRGSMDRAELAVHGASAAGEPGWDERRFDEHGDEVEHPGAVAAGQGESDEEAVASAAAGPRAVAASAAGEAGERWGQDDDYKDSGEWVEGGEDVYSARGGGGGGGGESADDLAQRSQQTDHAYDDEYEWVQAPGGTASAKWVRWKQEADEAMHGGEPEPGVALS